MVLMAAVLFGSWLYIVEAKHIWIVRLLSAQIILYEYIESHLVIVKFSFVL